MKIILSVIAIVRLPLGCTTTTKKHLDSTFEYLRSIERITRPVLLCVLCLTLTGCPLDDINRSIQQAADTIDRNSQQWQIVLQRLEDKLAAEGESALRNEVQSLANRTIATGGNELRCNVDFMGHRISQGLRRILARRRGRPVPPLVPGFCQVDPTDVQVALIRDHRLTSLNYYGYDMFENSAQDARMRVFLRNRAGIETDISFAIALPTHYLMTINVSDSQIHYSDEGGDKLVVRYETTDVSTINVIPPPRPGISVSKFGVVFDTLDENKDNDTGITLQINNVTVWSMPQTGGIARAFAAHHADPYPFPLTAQLADLPGKTLKICIQPNGDDTWTFNMRLYGSRSDSSDFQQPDTVRNCVFNSPDLKCYISDQNNVRLTHDDPCREWVLGSGSVAR